MVWGGNPKPLQQRLLGMNIKDRHHDKQNEPRNDAEHRNHRNKDGKTNQKSG